jgi:hypothetical protein
MSKDLALNPTTNDLEISNSLLRLTENQEQTTRQKVQIYLGMFRGECFWSILEGIPYLANDNNNTQLLSKNTTDKRFVDVVIKQAILEREGIIGITSYSSFLDSVNRKLSISFSANTVSGEIITIDELELEI